MTLINQGPYQGDDVLVSKLRKKREYALYQNDDVVFIGSLLECAAFFNVNCETIEWLASNTCWRRITERKSKNYRIAVRVDDEDTSIRDW